MRHLPTEPSHIEHPTAVEVTVQPTVVRVPTQLPPTPEPTLEPTLEPTARPVGANYTVKDGDSMINIVKHVCRGLGYELWDQYLIADLADMNINHNRQYIGKRATPLPSVGAKRGVQTSRSATNRTGAGHLSTPRRLTLSWPQHTETWIRRVRCAVKLKSSVPPAMASSIIGAST